MTVLFSSIFDIVESGKGLPARNRPGGHTLGGIYMQKVNFVSNPCINIFINDDEPFQIRPIDIPVVLLESLSACTSSGKETILSLSLFIDKDYDNYVRALIVAWDGCIATKHMYKLYEDGTFETSKHYKTQMLV